MKAYNGWPGSVRKHRGGLFYKMMHKGLIPQASSRACEGCGAKGYPGMTYHAEEYGPTWDDYLRNCYCLCARCHGMIHVRLSIPNRFKRYKKIVSTIGPAAPLKSLNTVYQMVKTCHDIGYVEDEKFGTIWDNFPVEGYQGEPKQALYRIVDPATKEVMDTIPDPLKDGADVFTLYGRVPFVGTLEL